MMTMQRILHLSPRQRLGLGGAVLLALGAAGGAGAVSLTRPTIEMAPTIPTTVSHLAGTNGTVTVRGRVAAVYGDRFLVQDQTGRALVDAGRGGASALTTGSPVLVQGRFDNGQLRAHYLVDAAGAIQEVGPGRPPHGDHGAPPPPPPGAGAPPPPPPGGPGAPPPPPGGPGAPPPPPGGPGAPAAGGPGAPPPPPGMAPGGPGTPPPPPPAAGAQPGMAPAPANGAPPAYPAARR